MSLIKKFFSLSRPARGAVAAFATVDATARIAAIRDLLKRDSSEVRGPKLLWLVLLAVVNSAGIVPFIYRKFAVQA